MAKQTSSGQFSITETPSLITCPRCPAPVMACTVSGIARHIDTATLNLVGELAALLEGRTTYNLYGDRMWRRDQFTIASGKRTYPVFRDHRCGPRVDDAHMDHAWMEAATAIIIHACGGVLVGENALPDQPPF